MKKDILIAIGVGILAIAFFGSIFYLGIKIELSPMPKTTREVCEEKGGVYTHGTIIFPEKCELKRR